MSLSVQTNIEAFDAHRNLVNTSNQLSNSMQKLSSGYRINKAADDAAGLAISEKLSAQVSGLTQAQQNAQDAVNLVQTADGAMGEVQSILARVRDLAVEFNNGTLSSSDQAAITAEVAQLCAEVSSIGTETSFNGIALLTGNATITFQVGANDGETIATSAVKLFGSGSGFAVDSALFNFSGSTISLSALDTAIENVSNDRATFGAVQNRLQHTLNNLGNYQENLSAAESSIKDVDMASEMVNFTKLQVLQQAGMSVLAQANQSSQSVLTLLRG
jgi:flagellin